jgi:hypothetical protein
MRDMQSLFSRVDLKCCCVQKSGKLRVNERSKAALPSRITNEEVALRSQRQDALYNVHHNSLQKQSDHFLKRQYTPILYAQQIAQTLTKHV